MSNFKLSAPELNQEKLSEKVQQFAEEAAISVIKDFYTGYNSPYKKGIEEALKAKSVNHAFDIPDIIQALNEKLSAEIDAIANKAVAHTFIPMIKDILLRKPAVAKISQLLSFFVECNDDDLTYSDYDCDVEEKDGSFRYIKLRAGRGEEYRIGFYNRGSNDVENWRLFNIPRSYSRSERKMKITLDEGASLELPFVPGILNDKFVNECAMYCLAETLFEFDTDDFDEGMFEYEEED